MRVTALASCMTCNADSFAKSAVTKNAFLQLVAGMRGGSQEPSATIDPSNLDRINLRLEGLSEYSVIATLLVNACMSLFLSSAKNLELGEKEQGIKFAKFTFCASTLISIIAGAYSAVVFTLLGLYSKTALGMGHDHQFLDFFTETTMIRKYAFEAFVVSLITFELSFVSSLYFTYRGTLKWFAVGLSSLLALISFHHWGMIIRVASKLLYAKE